MGNNKAITNVPKPAKKIPAHNNKRLYFSKNRSDLLLFLLRVKNKNAKDKNNIANKPNPVQANQPKPNPKPNRYKLKEIGYNPKPIIAPISHQISQLGRLLATPFFAFLVGKRGVMGFVLKGAMGALLTLRLKNGAFCSLLSAAGELCARLKSGLKQR